MHDNRQSRAKTTDTAPVLPAHARLSLNRCALPASLIGGLLYQAHPAALEIDGVHALHADLFTKLAMISLSADRARQFMDYMQVHFRLHRLEDAGLGCGSKQRKRTKADYLRMIRGWSFDSNSREGAVLKSWVETRFGLLARYHRGSLGDRDSEARHRFMREATAGIYATNAIEAQLDLLYSYCQYELGRLFPNAGHRLLYRGVNRIDEHEVLNRHERGRYDLLLNNLNSFTENRERADEFGDYILEAAVPLPKILFFSRLLPKLLKGEDEYLVIGGVYRVTIHTL